ncbi:hypothetical protein [Legionella spiritensis]|uniref:Transmembrane protein n=1 Tax=Legionella spiritensis TaxID=452 RepID=A0A0W0ZAK0_LEGSP|nr:hypothetical protein [Legionella spiritensis]KTD66148.1 hypothetical protein Lspi_0211 [Legionella spiritensis]SNV43930.1 Uncharacterised protein [Legionella spiritensis]
MNNNRHSSVSPGMMGAVFFALFAVLFFIFAKYTLLSLQSNQLLPFFPSMFITLILGALLGWLFGPWLATAKNWGRSLGTGILMALLSLLLISLGAFLYSYLNDTAFFARLQNGLDYLIVYGVLFLSIVLTIGVWLIPLMAIAAVYFNKRFWPGLIAIEQMNQPSPHSGIRHVDNDKQ